MQRCNHIQLFLADLAGVLSIRQAGYQLIWVLRLTNVGIDLHLAKVSRNYETSLVDQELLNVESLAIVSIIEDLSVLSVLLAEYELSLVSSHQDPSFGQPAMCSVVGGQVSTLFLAEVADLGLHVVVLHNVELVGVISRDKDIVRVHITEGDLGSDGVARWMVHILMRQASCLIDGPEVHFLLRLIGQGGEEPVILGSKGHGYEGFLDVDLLGEDHLSLLEGLAVRLLGLLPILFLLILYLVDGNDGRLLAFLSDGEPFLIVGECHGSYAFRALDTLEYFLSLLVQVVDHNVVTNGVDHLSVVQKVDVILDIAFEARDELGLEHDVGVARSGIPVSLHFFVCVVEVGNALNLSAGGCC